jgi:hypothetical protein
MRAFLRNQKITLLSLLFSGLMSACIKNPADGNYIQPPPVIRNPAIQFNFKDSSYVLLDSVGCSFSLGVYTLYGENQDKGQLFQLKFIPGNGKIYPGLIEFSFIDMILTSGNEGNSLWEYGGYTESFYLRFTKNQDGYLAGIFNAVLTNVSTNETDSIKNGTFSDIPKSFY